MKRVLIVLAVAAGLAACNPSTPTGVDAVPPATPATLRPADGASFSYFPRNVTLGWSAVTDPSGVTYRVETQYQGGGWSPLGACTGEIRETTCDLVFVGAQVGRWRVQAVDGAGNASGFSAWSYFSFTV